MQNTIREIVLFSLDEPRYAVAASHVIRVVRAVEVTPLPKAPDTIMGVINFHGEILPVIDIRRLFRLPSRDIRLEDQFIIVRTSHRRAVIVVDSVIGVHLLDQHQQGEIQEAFPFTEYVSGIVSIQQSLILINDLDAFLSLDDERILDQALSGVDHDG
jgi:purine-binding chemotaxis protein CheW